MEIGRSLNGNLTVNEKVKKMVKSTTFNPLFGSLFFNERQNFKEVFERTEP